MAPSCVPTRFVRTKQGITGATSDPNPSALPLFAGSLNCRAVWTPFPSLPFPVLVSAASWGLWGSCTPGPDLASAVVPEPFLSALLEEAGAGALASIRLEKPGLLLTEPGVTAADAGLTVTGLALTGALEQTEEGRADFVSDWRAKSHKRGGKRTISVDSSFTCSEITVNYCHV